ncbi:hypothetical protein FKM82_017930 [Ascaphus truei]
MPHVSSKPLTLPDSEQGLLFQQPPLFMENPSILHPTGTVLALVQRRPATHHHLQEHKLRRPPEVRLGHPAEAMWGSPPHRAR